MTLIEALDKYYVAASGFSDLVGWTEPDRGREIAVTWSDSDEDYTYYFNADQPITPAGAVAGLFTVTSVDGETWQFLALDGVDLAGK